MTTPRFTWTDRARPVIEIGVGDVRIDQPAGQWDVARWDTDGAEWSGLEPIWLEVTCDAFTARCEYGRQRSTDRFVPGAASVVVWNATGWADPRADFEPGVLTMRPGRAIRIGIAHTTLGTRWLYRGFIDAMTPVYDPTQPDTVELSCIDALGEVNRAKVKPVDPPAYAGDYVDTRIGRVLDAAAWPAQKRRLDPTGDTLIADAMGGQVADLLGQAADSGGGNVFGDLEANVVYRARDWQTFVPGTPPDGSIGNVDTDGTPGYVIPGTPDVPGYLDPTKGYAYTLDTPDMRIDGAFRLTWRASHASIGAGFPAVFDKTGTGTANREMFVYASAPANIAWSTANAALAANTDGTVANPAPLGAPHTYGFESTPGSTAYVSIVDAVRTARTAPSVPAWPDTTAQMIIGGSALVPGPIYWAQLERISRAALVFPGTVGSYLSIPSAANLTPTDDFDIVARIAPTTWRPTAQQAIAARYTATGNQRSWAFAVATAGQLVLVMSTTGSDAPQGVSTSAVPNDGAARWVRATRVRSTGVVTFYTAPDADVMPAAWTQLGTTVTVAAGSAMFAATAAPVEIGSVATGTTQMFAGRIRRVILRNAIGSTTPVLDVADTSVRLTGSTFPAVTGQTVTVWDAYDSAFLAGNAGTVSTPDPGVLPTSFVIVYRARNVVSSGFPVNAAQTTGADPRSWQTYPTLVNTRVNFEATPDGLWTSRQNRYADRPIPALNVDRTEAIAVTTNAAGRHLMTAWAYDDSTRTWAAGTTRDTGAALTPFDVTTTLSMGGGYVAGERLYWSEMRTGTDPRGGALLWRFDANERTGTGLTYTDPRGRVWTLTATTAIVPKATAPIVQPIADAVVWRFDANEYTGTGTGWIDPRGRSWVMSVAGSIVPKIPGTPDVVVPAVPGDVCPTRWERPFARSDLATRVIIGRDPATAFVLDDVEAQYLYGIEPFERVDLLTERDDKLMLLGERIMRVRSAFAAPRIRSVTLDARTADSALDMMSTVDVYKPSRYRCRLELERGLVFDAEHFATGIVHEITPSMWQADINLDLAAPYAAAGGRWDGAYWDQATWADDV